MISTRSVQSMVHPYEVWHMQGGPSGRGQAIVDTEIRDVLYFYLV